MSGLKSAAALISRLRRAEAIETTGIIRPLRIAEIGGTARERVGCHRRPDGIAQIRAGFHHERLASGPVDVESELIRLHAKAGVAGLHLRQPQRGQDAGIVGEVTPPRGSRQVIDDHIVITVKHIPTSASHLSLKCLS